MTDLEVIPPGDLYPKPPPLSIAQIEEVRKFLAPGLNDDELSLFVAIVNRSGLDPFYRQIWAYKRGDKLVIQASIDGLRLIALRTGLYGGQTSSKWCGPDRQWTDVWLEKTPPAAAMAAVFRKDYGQPTTAVAVWDSYAATKDGKPQAVWATAGDVMLAKCAEALALRKAFPAETAGLYVAGEIPLDEPVPVTTAGPEDLLVAGDDRGYLKYALENLSEQGYEYAKGQAKADLVVVDGKIQIGIPNIASPKFRRSHRDRLAWHIIVAQRIKPAAPVDEPTPPAVHDDAPDAVGHDDGTERYDPQDGGLMPARINVADLPSEVRAKLVGRARSVAPVAPRPTATHPAQWVCLTCGLRTPHLAVIERHCDAARHYRYTDLGMGL